MSPLQDWLSPAMAAAQVGVTSQRIRQLVDEGRLVAVKTNLGHLIDPESVERLRAERAARHPLAVA